MKHTESLGQVKDWLKSRFKANDADMEEIIKYDFALYFLMTWNIFETCLFEKSCQLREALENEDRINQLSNFIDDEFTETIRAFFDRYKDNEKYVEALFHGNRDNRDRNSFEEDLFQSFLDGGFDQLKSNSSKVIKFTFCVIIRYRNNMFHGNKYVGNWSKYKKQVIDCTSMMQWLIDKQRLIDKSQQKLNSKNT